MKPLILWLGLKMLEVMTRTVPNRDLFIVVDDFVLRFSFVSFVAARVLKCFVIVSATVFVRNQLIEEAAHHRILPLRSLFA